MPLDVQAKSLTNRLVPVLWACQRNHWEGARETERYCLEVAAPGYCEVVPVIEGVTCDVDGGAITASLGSCF
jgi:hypothetical protein